MRDTSTPRVAPKPNGSSDAAGTRRGGNLRTALVLAVIALVFFAGIIVNRVMHG